MKFQQLPQNFRSILAQPSTFSPVLQLHSMQNAYANQPANYRIMGIKTRLQENCENCRQNTVKS